MNDLTTSRRSGNLIVLVCYTILGVTLAAQSVLLEWKKTPVVLLLIGVVISWFIHITGKVDQKISLWIYAVLTMLAFFYLGMHEDLIYDMAPISIAFILLMGGTEERWLPRLCSITYYFTMTYALLFVAESIQMNALDMIPIVFHYFLVFIVDRLVKMQQQERQEFSDAINAKMYELEENNHKIENFLVNVSHELRTPINAIMGFTSVILDKEKDAEKRRDVLSIQKAGHRLFDQIEDILDYTEIDMKSITVNHADYMISSVVNDIVVGERSREREHPTEIIFDVDPLIPARLVGDDRKVKKILKHLIDNAVKFTPHGAVLVEISGRQKEYGINLYIRVTDTGVGIKEENIKKISGEFYQQNGERNRSASGLGLGLSIVYGIVTAMGGFVKIESKEGQGTSVSVSIPQKIADESPTMSVENPEDLCVACYLRPEKYESARVYKFYDNMISNMGKGLNIQVHRAGTEAELTRILSKYRVTHLFTAREEYEERAEYYEDLSREIGIIVVTDDVKIFPKDSRVLPLEKPFYFLPIIDIFNRNDAFHSDLFDMRRILCPGIRALVVDDEPMNLMVAEEILKGYQMEVKTASSGRKAIDLCMEEGFDLIFLDHMMPGMDGIETLKVLRRNDTGKGHEKNNRMVIIAFTANAVSGAREMFLSEGFDEFISKPIEIIELDRVLKKVLPRAAITFVSEDELEDVGQDSAVPVQDTRQDEKAAGADSTGQEVDTDENAAAGKADEPKDAYAALEQAGIHTKSGLSYCAGDEAFYQKIMESFAADAKQKTADMQAFLEKEDWKNYQILVHALKSTARMIGADELSGMAKQAEDAAKESDGSYITANEDTLMKKYSRVVQAISEAFGLKENDTDKEQADAPKERGEEETQPPDGTAGELSAEEFKKHLLDLKEALDTFEADQANEVIAQMQDSVYQGVSVREHLQDILQDIESFELSAAADKTEALLDGLKGGEA